MFDQGNMEFREPEPGQVGAMMRYNILIFLNINIYGVGASEEAAQGEAAILFGGLDHRRGIMQTTSQDREMDCICDSPFLRRFCILQRLSCNRQRGLC